MTGFSAGGVTRPSLYELARVGDGMRSIDGDVRDPDAVSAAVRACTPELVIHMAAQSLVRRALAEPRETYEINVMGTVNLLDAVRQHGDGVRAVVIVTSDKCYRNREWEHGYREHDAMGGDDPYSSSKGCAELVTDAFRRSYFWAGSPAAGGLAQHGARLASARAGNVIGGGDWGQDRLIPDIRAALAGEGVRVRRPHAVRPWQHVLNALSGYLRLAQALWESPEHACAWNFGPPDEDARTVGWIVLQLGALWPGGVRWELDDGPNPNETGHLRLDSSRAPARLGWRPAFGLEVALQSIVDWYRALQDGADMRAVTLGQLERFQLAAARLAVGAP